MSLRWKRIMYWMAIGVVLAPVLYADTLMCLPFGSNDTTRSVQILAIVVLLIQSACTLCFIRKSLRRQFHHAFVWLALFGMSGFAALVAALIDLGNKLAAF